MIIGPFQAISLQTVLAETLRWMQLPVVSGMLVLILAGFVIAAARSRSLGRWVGDPYVAFAGSLLTFSVGQIIFYCILRVSYWAWYIFPLHMFIAVSAGVAVPQIGRSLGKSGFASRIGAAAVLVVGLAVIGSGHGYLRYRISVWFQTVDTNEHLDSYLPIARYLKVMEPSGTSIATAEPGAFGFALGPAYKVIDVLGLTSPGVATNLIVGNL